MLMRVAEPLISRLQFMVLLDTEVAPGRFQETALVRNDGGIIDPRCWKRLGFAVAWLQQSVFDQTIRADASLEPACIALTLTPPSEPDIAREIGHDVDPDAIFAARKHLRAAIGDALGPTLASTYRQMMTPGPYHPDAESAGRRALKNACLDLLAMTESDAAIARAFTQYRNADNMTDRMAALETLAAHDRAERATAFDDFYQLYAEDPLVIDKWFSLQAIIPEPQTLDRVRALTSHPAFSAANPNRIRALIGAFAQANHTQFNRRDGAGYDFVADFVLELDSKNPQVAARLMSAFRSWRALEAQRRGRAEATLRRVAATPALSPDVRDIVMRTLADVKSDSDR